MLVLKEANVADLDKEWLFVREMPSEENGVTNSWHDVSKEDFETKVLPSMISNSKGIDLPEWMVPETVLFLWDDDKIVGQFQIRHFLNDALREGAGHIGYFIGREFRGRGFAKEGLRMTLEVAKNIVPEDEFYFRVDKNNQASVSVIMSNGGRIVEEKDNHLFIRIKNGMEEKNSSHPNWRFCVVGNVIKRHKDEHGKMYYGTKTFTGGTKIYINGRNWNEESEKVCVIGLNRFGRFVEESIPVKLIENVRLITVHKETVLDMMCADEQIEGFEWYGRKSIDKKLAKEFIDRINNMNTTDEKNLTNNNIFEQIEKNIDNLVENQADWTACATKEQLDEARKGNIIINFYEDRVPKEWLEDIRGKKVLCLAGAGGLQAPILACAGADVTVIDISEKMLEKDREIAAREQLDIKIVKGNMCDLSMFADESFDYIINPPSLMYIPDLKVVFDECYRVMAKGGAIIVMAPCPVNYLCDWVDDGNGGYYKAVNRMPWCSTEHMESDWIEYGHTMESYLGGLIQSGFVLDGYMECQMEDITELMFMARGRKIIIKK